MGTCRKGRLQPCLGSKSLRLQTIAGYRIFMRFQVVFAGQSGRGGSRASDLRLHLSGVPLADHFRLKQLAAEQLSESLLAIPDLPIAPVDLKGAAALVRLFAHRMVHFPLPT